MPTSHHLRSAAARRIARAALVDFSARGVGRHRGVIVHDVDTATHRFAAHVPGYRGWEWHVVVACVPECTHITVNEIALMPGRDALQAPDWVPWAQRIQPGDVQPGYVMPPAPDDERLSDSPGGKILSSQGLGSALDRWQTGDYGPESAFAEEPDDHCETCAFYLPIGAPAGKDFGACVNEYAADGRVVHAHYGCGAHSNTRPAELLARPRTQPYDDEEWA